MEDKEITREEYKTLSEWVDLSKKSKDDNKSDYKETESDSFKKLADKWIEQAAKVREARIMERNFINDEELRTELNKMNDTITNVTNHDKTNEPFGIREDKLMRRSEAKKAVSDYYDKIVDKDEANDEESNESYVKDFIKDWKDKIEEFENKHPKISAEWCDKTENLRLKDIKIADGGESVDLSDDCKIKFTFNLPDDLEKCGLEYKPLEPSVFCNGVGEDETFKSNKEFNNTEQGGGNKHDDKPYWYYEPSSELVETLSDEEIDTEEPEPASNNCDDEGLPVNNKYQILYYDKKQVFEEDGPTVYRIKALRDIGSDVKKGDLGGYIESEKNLSIDGDCWVYDNACVFEDARVLKNAKVKDESIIAGHAIITDNAITEQESCIFGYTMIGGNVRTTFMFRIYSPTVFLGNSILKGHEDYLLFKPEHRIINALISYCIPSDTWTCYYRYELVVFNSTEDFISHIKENWSRFIKDEEDYLYTCIEMAKKCKERYNIDKKKKEVVKPKENSTEVKFSHIDKETKNKKYEVLYDKKEKPLGEYGATLYRIKALRDIGSDVKKGDLGGFVEGEHNLSATDDCWIYDNSCVLGDAFIGDKARVKDNSTVFGDSYILGNSIVEKKSTIFGSVTLQDNVKVTNGTTISICGTFGGDSVIGGKNDFLLFKHDDSENIIDLITYCIPSDTWTYQGKNFTLWVNTEDFVKCINVTPNEFEYNKNYLLSCVEMAKKNKELYNMNKEKQEIHSRDNKMIFGGNNRIELDEVKFSGTVEELYKHIINKDDKFLLDSFEINYVKDQIMDVYNLVVLNTDNGETTNLHVSGKTLIHFYRYGEKLEAITAEELYLEDYGMNEIQLKTLSGFDDITIINVIKINNYYTQRMFEIRGLNLDNRLFQTFNGQEPLFTI